MLNDALQRIAQKVNGALAVMVVGLDGFIIEQNLVKESPLSLESVAAEAATLLRQAQSSAADLEGGIIEEISLRTDHYYILTRTITNEYFLCLVLTVDGNFGRARFEMRRAQELVKEEFVL